MGEPTLSLYVDRSAASLDFKSLVRYLEGLCPHSKLKGDFFDSVGASIEEAAVELARCRILDLTCEGGLNLEPGARDIEEEIAVLRSKKPLKLKENLSNVYDGFALARMLKRFVKQGLHLVFTSRMLATFEGSRYHGQTIVMDFPIALISTTGIVEAPAKPREFYIKLAAYQRARQAGFKTPAEEGFMKDLKEEFKGRFIDYDDLRMTQIVIGYALQAFFYLFFGEAFCENPCCRLYNAHTQEDLIRAQIKNRVLCKRHQLMLK